MDVEPTAATARAAHIPARMWDESLPFWRRCAKRGTAPTWVPHEIPKGGGAPPSTATMSKDDDVEIEPSNLRQVAPRRSRSWWPAFGSVAVLASALGAWLLAGPRASSEERAGDKPMGGFSEKGGTAPRHVPVFDLRCATPTGECRIGDTLMFSVQGALAGGHLSAYAERAGDASHSRIWYFPSETGAGPHVEATSGNWVVPEGVKLAAPHVPGLYRVTLWLSERAAPRGAAPAGTSRGLALEVVD